MKNETESNIFPEHLLDLRASGLSDKTIEEAGLYSIDRLGVKKLVGWAPQEAKSGLVFPYTADFARVKIFPSAADSNGHTVRYLQPKDSPPQFYIPKGVERFLTDPSLAFFLVEGEKKALAGWQKGLPFIAIGGLWSWLSNNRPITDFDRIKWEGRRVTLVGDSDVWQPKRDDLRLAIFSLAKEIENRGGKAHFIVLDSEVKL